MLMAMKNKTLFITCLAAAAFDVGCKPADEKTAAQQMDQVQTETRQAAQDMKDYTFAEKAEFVKAMQDQLAVLDRNLDQLAYWFGGPGLFSGRHFPGHSTGSGYT